MNNKEIQFDICKIEGDEILEVNGKRKRIVYGSTAAFLKKLE